jgi:predicted transcriptional regulator YdeE
VEYRIVTKPAFTLLGLMERFTPDNEDFEGIWKRFMEHYDPIHALSTDKAYYGACFGTGDERQMDYLAGMTVGGVGEVSKGLTVRVAPASRYAVFECTVTTISNTYDRIFGEWVPTAPYARPGQGSAKADFERYPPNTDSGDTPVLLYIALEEGES